VRWNGGITDLDANQALRLGSGIVIFNPIPQEYSIPQVEIEVVIQDAVRDCERKGIMGKDITPFLLQRVVHATQGRSLQANIALIKNNARIGAQIAVKLSSLNSVSAQQTAHPPAVSHTSTTEDTADIVIIGSMAVDLTCKLTDISSGQIHELLHTSHPSEIHTSTGGVGHNVALAASYASASSVRLITAIGDDPGGSWLRQYAQTMGLDVRSIPAETETARYVAIHDREGDLVTAAADMRIIEKIRDHDVRREIKRAQPKWLAFDGNLSPSIIKSILEETPNTKGITVVVTK
jgi:pseudouridine-5'-phosphate glycosidase/pseudouridine kinase